MDNPNSLSQSRIHIETDELILCLRQDQAFYAEVVDRKTIFLAGSNLNYNVNNSTEIKLLLMQNGFIRVTDSCYVNPLQIQEYNFKERKVELSNGRKLVIGLKYMDALMAFFSTQHSNLKQL